MKSFRLFVVLSLAALLTVSCMPQSKTGQGALFGAGGGAVAGALVGQLAGGDSDSTLKGAAIGAALGGLGGAGVGKMMDNQERDMRAALAQSEAASIRREGNLLAISLKGDVTFDKNSATLRPGLHSEIERIANILYQYPQTIIRVEGHTDSRGAADYNYNLSQRRTDSVKNLLVQRSVAAHRVETKAFGESMPVATNDTEAGRQRNRRVEIKVAPTQQ